MTIKFLTATNLKGQSPGKHFHLNTDGTLSSKVEGSRLRTKLAETEAETPEALAQLLRDSGPETHLLAAGVGHPDAIAIPADPMKRALEDGQTNDKDTGLPLVGLTASFLKRPQGGGLLVIDADGMTAEDARSAVLRAAPGLADAAMVCTSSSSSNIYDAQGQERLGDRGAHIFIGIANGTDVARAIKTLHRRCWLTGAGVGKISKTGAFHERGPVDRAMAVQTQPVFIRATLGHGLRQNKVVRVFPGTWGIDSQAVITDLSDEERSQYARLVGDARAALKDEAAAKRAAYVAGRAADLVKANGGRISEEQARGIVSQALNGGELAAEFRLVVEGAWVTVAEILKNPTAFHGRTCRDPLEQDYGSPTVAKLYTDGSVPVVHSFAHGGRTFRLAGGRAVPMTAEQILQEFQDEEDEAIQRLRGDAELSAWLTPAVTGRGQNPVPCADGIERPARVVAEAMLRGAAEAMTGPDRPSADGLGLRYRLPDGRVVQVFAALDSVMSIIKEKAAKDPEEARDTWAALAAGAMQNPLETSIATDVARALRIPVAGIRGDLYAAVEAHDADLRTLFYRATPHPPADAAQVDPDDRALDEALGSSNEAALLHAEQYGIDCEKGRLKRVGADLKLIGRTDAKGNALPDITAIHGGNPRIEAAMRSGNSDAWGRVLAFENLDGVTHRVMIQMNALEGDAVAVRAEAAHKGLLIDPVSEAALAFLTFVKLYPTAATYRCTGLVGWDDGVYVLPDRSYGPEADQVIYSTSSGRVAAAEFDQRGTATEWRDNVASMAVGNTRLTLVACVGFAGPLLKVAGAESGFIHLHSHSSGGKTSVSNLMASIYGPPAARKRSWRATANALESVAAGHNDAALWLDEIAQAKAEEVDHVVYTVGNGAGKLRSDRSGAVRQGFTWRTLVLSNGEMALETLLGRAGHVLDAGLAVRMVSVPADPGKGMGVWDVLPDGIETPAEASNVLVERCAQFHGAVGAAWVENLAHRGKKLVDDVAHAIQAAQTALDPERPLSPQARRVLARFALLAAAGEMATAAGLTGWRRGWASEAIRSCFQDWLEAQQGGGSEQLEDARAVDLVRSFLQTQISRFVRQGESASTHVRDVAGIVIGTGMDPSTLDPKPPSAFWIYPSVFKNEVCADIEHRQVAKALADRGLLLRDAAGKFQQSVRPLPGQKVRMFVIDASVLSDQAS